MFIRWSAVEECGCRISGSATPKCLSSKCTFHRVLFLSFKLPNHCSYDCVPSWDFIIFLLVLGFLGLVVVPYYILVVFLEVFVLPISSGEYHL